MNKNSEPSNKIKEECVNIAQIRINLYHKPKLEKLGDVRTLTLGTSPGGGDSLDPLNRKP